MEETNTPDILCPELADPLRRNIITLDNLNGLALTNYSRVPGTETDISCRQPDQYTLHGADFLVCLDDGQWDRPIPTCVKACPVLVRHDLEDNPTPNPFGDFLLSNNNRTFGSEVDIECLQPNQYAFIGTQHLTCQEDLLWDNPIPICSRKYDCPTIVRHERKDDLDEDLFGDFLLSNTSQTPGTEVDVECLQPDSYDLIGNSHLICQNSGRWDNPMPYCFRNASVIVNTTTSPVVNSSQDLLTPDETVILSVVGTILSALLIAIIVTLTYILCRAKRRKDSKSNNTSTLYTNNGYSIEETESLVELFALPRPMVSVFPENISESLYSLPLNQLSVHQPASRHRSYSMGSTGIPLLHSSADGGVSTIPPMRHSSGDGGLSTTIPIRHSSGDGGLSTTALIRHSSGEGGMPTQRRRESIPTSTFDSGEHSFYSQANNGNRSLVLVPKPAYSTEYGPFWYYPDVPDDPVTAASAMRTVVDVLHETGSIKRPYVLYPLRPAPGSDGGYASYSDTRDGNTLNLGEADIQTYI